MNTTMPKQSAFKDNLLTQGKPNSLTLMVEKLQSKLKSKLAGQQMTLEKQSTMADSPPPQLSFQPDKASNAVSVFSQLPDTTTAT